MKELSIWVMALAIGNCVVISTHNPQSLSKLSQQHESHPNDPNDNLDIIVAEIEE